MSFQLRYYQEDAVKVGIHHLNHYDSPFVLVLPTGSGKSIVISEILHRIDEPMLVLQPSAEILQQNYDKLISYGITDIGVFSASMKSKTINKFTYATIGSIHKKPELFTGFKRVIIDECHDINPKNLGGMYNSFFKALGITSICGLTAFPGRLLQKTYVDKGELVYTSQLMTINRIHPFFFKKFAYNISIRELMDKGYLCIPRYKFYNEFDLSKLRINSTGADFVEEDISKFWSSDKLKKLSQIICEIDKECKHNLIFCSTIRQAMNCAEMLRTMGLSADHISSSDDPKTRASKLYAFRTGRIKHMCNVGVLTTGYDFPALDAITLARATISLGLLYQMCGRGLRKDPDDPNKVAKIYDITSNITRLGRIETIKLEKEDGYKDIVTTERGQISGKPLFRFRVEDEKKKQAYLENKKKLESTLTGS